MAPTILEAAGLPQPTSGTTCSTSRRSATGDESGTTVTPDYDAHGSRFTGKIHWVQLDTGKDDNDHFIDPEERLRVAMARQ